MTTNLARFSSASPLVAAVAWSLAGPSRAFERNENATNAAFASVAPRPFPRARGDVARTDGRSLRTPKGPFATFRKTRGRDSSPVPGCPVGDGSTDGDRPAGGARKRRRACRGCDKIDKISKLQLTYAYSRAAWIHPRKVVRSLCGEIARR